jgi:hypothetical protein
MSQAPAQPRSPLLAELQRELDRIEPRTRAAVAGLSEAIFHDLPPDGGWSVAQVFEHLCVANLAYLDGPLVAAVASARARGPVNKSWRPSLVGGMLASMLVEGSKAMPAPGLFRVGPATRANVVDEFLATITRTRALMVELDGHDLRVGLTSPTLPLIRINLGDAFKVLVIHAHRHLGQVERTRRAVGM